MDVIRKDLERMYKIICKHKLHFDVHVTVHRDKFLIINQLDAPISQIYFGVKLYMFRTVPPSITRSFPLYTQQWYMPYRFADSLRAGSVASGSASSHSAMTAACNDKHE